MYARIFEIEFVVDATKIDVFVFYLCDEKSQPRSQEFLNYY